MTSQNEVADLAVVLKSAVASGLNEQQERVSIEIKEFSRIGQAYTVSATFKVTPFFVTRTGNVFAAFVKTEKGFEITSLKIIEDKGL